MIRTPYGIRSERIYRAVAPVRDPAYLAFVRSLSCLVCGHGRCDAAHTGPHGLGQKACDFSCVPLCRRHHREMHQGPGAFIERYGLDIAEAIAQNRAMWERRRKKTA